MKIDSIDISKSRIDKILKILETKFNIKLNLDDEESLISLFGECEMVRKSIIESSPYNSYCSNREYIESYLIQEAIKIFLSEIAPGRKSGNTKRKNRGA